MTKTWTNPTNGKQIEVVVIETYGECSEPMYLVRKATAKDGRMTFGVRVKDCN